MIQEWINHHSKYLLATLFAGAVTCGGITRLSADEPKPEAKSEQKAAPAKVEAKQADPHAGHDHGPTQPGKTPNPNDPPAPTVVLKEGEVPAIKFDTPVFDFGKVRSGTDIKHDFFFSNSGTGPLELLRVKPSCGCTVAGQYTRVVEKGETGKIPITLSTKNANGPVTKTVTVNTNCSGADSTIMLQIKGEVWQPVQVTPQAAAFGRITTKEAGDSLVRKLTIVNNLEEPLKLGEPTSNNPKIKATVATLEEGKKYEISVSMVPPLDPGNNSGRISMTTGVAEMPTIEVQAYAFVTAAIDVTPISMVLPAQRTAAMSRQFYIRSNLGTPIKISDLQTTNPDLKMELSDIKEGQTYRLKVDVPASYVPPTNGDKITFKTDSKEVPEITIPVTLQAPMTMISKPAAAIVKPTVPTTEAKPTGANAAAAKPAPAKADEKPSSR